MEFAWKAPDGEEFACLEWPPTGDAAGVLVCVHGMGGAAGDFAPVGVEAARAGFAVYVPNLRGQGMDRPPRRGAWLDLSVLGADLAAFCAMARERHPAAPLFLCGESMGALIVAWLLANKVIPEVKGTIFSVPVVELAKPTPWVVRQLVRALAVALPLQRFSPAWFVNGKTEPLKLTRDESHRERLLASAHYIPVFAFRFLNRLGNLIESSRSLARAVDTPCLVLAAGNDAFLRPDQVQAWFDEIAATDKTLAVYPESYHLLWHDWDRDEVLADMLGWLEERR